MKETNKTGAWVRLIVSSVIALLLIAILIMGIIRKGSGFPLFSFNSFSYPNGDRYTAGNTSIKADQLKNLEINWVSGTIDVEAYEGDTIEITETSSHDLDEADRVHSYYANGELTIQFCKSQFFVFGSRASKKLLIKIPKALAADIQNFTLDSVTSDNHITGLSVKHCDIDTVSGEITMNGDVQDFALDTVSGDCELTSHTTPADINVDSVSAEVTLLLPADTSFTAEQDSVSGKLSSDFPTTLSDDDTYICGDGGRGEWNFDSVSGDVRIMKNHD